MNKTIIYICFLFFAIATHGKTYYFDATHGNDTNSGLAPNKAFKSLFKIKTLNLKPGDVILLHAGGIFHKPLHLENIHGTSDAPIKISTFKNSNTEAAYAYIESFGPLNALLIKDCSYLKIDDLDISASASKNYTSISSKKAMRCGVLITTSAESHTKSITLDNLKVHDVFFNAEGYTRPKWEVKTANGKQNYGWGIRVINKFDSSQISDVKILNTQVYNVAHTGIKLTGNFISNVEIAHCEVSKTGGPGMQMSRVSNVHVHHNNITNSGSKDDSRKWGRGSCLWTWGSTNVLIEYNTFMNANGPADSAGVHIDFNCSDVIIQYNYSANNAGGFCEILGNNYNCAYRYNISVNDGHRMKGQNGAFQQGKTLWLSGFVGKGNERNGPFNSYIYNNTIIASENIISKYAIDRASSGVLIKNNIFYIKGESQGVLGDQYKPEQAGVSRVENIVFENNLYLKQTNWPKATIIQDDKPHFGDAGLSTVISEELQNYIPTNKAIIKDQGDFITPIPGDSKGLNIGLQLNKDILGNPILDKPDMGAIEIPN